VLDNLIFFFKEQNIIISKSFFYSQAGFLSILKDILYSFLRLRSFSSDFENISGSVNISDNQYYCLIKNLESDIAISRGNSNNTKKYSSFVSFKEIPDPLIKVINQNIFFIKKYLGDNFLYENPIVWRNYNLPNYLETYDVYSNIWHQDSHDGNRLLKIFVLLHDVGESSGPFVFLNFKDTKKLWFKLANRWDFEKTSLLSQFTQQKLCTGSRGDYLIINTAKCMHRASIPSAYRDILQITLYPNWRACSGRRIYDM
jgi:hypothetical protein